MGQTGTVLGLRLGWFKLNCPKCGAEIPSYTFTKQITKSGNSLVLSIPEEVCKVLSLKHEDILQVTVTKL